MVNKIILCIVLIVCGFAGGYVYSFATADFTMTQEQANKNNTELLRYKAYYDVHQATKFAEDDYDVVKQGNEFLVTLRYQKSTSIVYRATTDQQARAYISGALDARR